MKKELQKRTEEYFNGNQFSIAAFNKKYKLNDSETYPEAVWRVCKTIASVEKKDSEQEYWAKRWFNEIMDDWWQPAGSIMQGAGNPSSISLANCFSEETEFITDQGVKSFKDFIDGQECMALTNYGGFDKATVRFFGTQKLKKLTFKKGNFCKDVFVTNDHVWRVIKGGKIVKKNTSELNIGDRFPHVYRTSHQEKFSPQTSKPTWKLDKIEETNREEGVWCLQVPKKECFVLADGLLTNNCTTLSLGKNLEHQEWDNLESIIRNTAYSVAKSAAYRQGLGVDFCLSPETLVLNTDLRWVRIDSLQEGDKLIAFDEELHESLKGNRNRYIRESVVEKVGIINRPSYKITTDKGEITASAEHEWLARKGKKKPDGRSADLYKWITSGELEVGNEIAFAIEPWQEDNSWEGGYMSGLLDGEGWIAHSRPFKSHVGIGQNEGLVWDKIISILDKNNIKYAKNDTKKCKKLSISGKWNSLKTLGMFRPPRLFNNRRMLWENKKMGGKTCPAAKVLKIEFVGDQNVVATRTSTRTLISNGFFSHNSRIRPRGTKVENSANESTGAVHWMGFIDNVANYVGQKGRIPAMLFSISCTHPDVEEFIKVKSDFTKIQNANISVQCSDNFYKAVKNDEDWNLEFKIPAVKKGDRVYVDANSAGIECSKDENGKYYYIAKKDKKEEIFKKKIKASKLLKLIAQNMTNFAEPGIQNIDIASKYSNSDYLYDPDKEFDPRVVSTNACCVTGSTPILYEHGYAKIKDFVGKKIKVWNGIKYSEVTPFLAAQNAPVYKVELSDGSYLFCTGNHKWRVEDKDGKEQEIITEDLEIGDKIYNYNFPVIDTETGSDPDRAYQHGVFCGDGQYNNAGKGVLLYGEKKKLAQILSKKESFNILDGDRIWITLPSDLPEKYEVPVNESLAYKLAWLSGWLDTDGCTVKSKSGALSIQASSNNFEFIYQIKLMLNTLGISPHISKLSDGKFQLMPDGKGGKKEYFRKPIWRMCINTKETLSLLSLGLNTHRLDFSNNIISKINRKKNITIKSVDFYGMDEVFCFTEPLNHTGCFNGIVTGQSEQYLNRDGLCILSSINCEMFSTEESKYKEELINIGESVNRFLDNVITYEIENNKYATELQRQSLINLRRTGAGYTNIAAWLFKQGLNYGESDANDAIENFTKWYNYGLYQSSIKLGKEKGSFEFFNRDKFIKSPFVKRMMKEFPDLKFSHMRNVTCSSIAPTGCIEENTRINTNKGLLKIKDLVNKLPEEKGFTTDLKENYEIFTDNGKSKIVKFYKNGKVNGYHIKLDDGRFIKVSETHRLRVFNNGEYQWKYAPDIKENDIIVSSKCLEGFDNIPYVVLKADNLSKHHNVSDCKLPTELNETLAEFLGLYTGDGSIKFRTENGKCDGLRFPVYEEDVDLLKRVKFYFKDIFGLDSSHVLNKEKRMYEVTCHSINLSNYIIENGLSKKGEISTIKECKNHTFGIPDKIFESPLSVRAAYLRGLFEADGSISVNNGVSISLSTAQEQLAKDVQEILFSLGIQSKIKPKNKENRKGAYGDKIYVVSIRFKSDKTKFANTIGFLSDRKNEKLNNSKFSLDYEPIPINKNKAKEIRLDIAKKLNSKSKLYHRINRCIQKHKDSKEVFFNRGLLEDIEKTGVSLGLPFKLENFTTSLVEEVVREEIDTYDIEVEDDSHTYITANGILNHNTLSLLFRRAVMSYGLEPAFGMYYWKRTRISGEYKYYFCVPRIVREVFERKGFPLPIESDTVEDTWDGQIGKPVVEFIEKNKDKIGVNFKPATEVSAFDKLDLMGKVMKWVDSSISITYMLPENSNWKDTYNFILKAWEKEVKSIAAFPDRKMYGIVSYIPFKDLAFKLKDEGVSLHYQYNFNEDELKELNYQKENIEVNTKQSPKRPETLDADIHVATAKGEKFIITVGLLNDQPYEVFGGKANGFGIKHKCRGKIIKKKKGQYGLELDSIEIDDFSKHFTPQEQTIFRLASTSLRHGVPIEFVVEQMQKSTDDMFSLPSALSRVLKKYIKDGQKVHGKSCPECGSHDLIYQDGCVSCSSCGWSKCE